MKISARRSGGRVTTKRNSGFISEHFSSEAPNGLDLHFIKAYDDGMRVNHLSRAIFFIFDGTVRRMRARSFRIIGETLCLDNSPNADIIAN